MALQSASIQSLSQAAHQAASANVHGSGDGFYHAFREAIIDADFVEVSDSTAVASITPNVTRFEGFETLASKAANTNLVQIQAAESAYHTAAQSGQPATPPSFQQVL